MAKVDADGRPVALVWAVGRRRNVLTDEADEKWANVKLNRRWRTSLQGQVDLHKSRDRTRVSGSAAQQGGRVVEVECAGK